MNTKYRRSSFSQANWVPDNMSRLMPGIVLGGLVGLGVGFPGFYFVVFLYSLVVTDRRGPTDDLSGFAILLLFCIPVFSGVLGAVGAAIRNKRAGLLAGAISGILLGGFLASAAPRSTLLEAWPVMVAVSAVGSSTGWLGCIIGNRLARS